MKKITTMFGVSTLQNTTNAIPAIQLQVDEFVLLETTGARSKKWSEGITEVLESRKISVLQPIELTKNEDARIDLILKRIYDFIKNHKGKTIYWNVGGGQKAQQIALWKAFEQRVRDGYNDKICYANPETKQIELWYYDDNNNFVSDFSETNADLTAKEIFQIFGLKVIYTESNILYSKQKLAKSNKKSYELFDYKKFRQYFFSVPQSSEYAEQNQKLLSIDDFENLFDSKKIDAKINQFAFEKLKKNSYSKNEIISIFPSIRKEIYKNIKEQFSKRHIPKIIEIEAELQNKIQEYTGKYKEKLVCNIDDFKNTFSDKIVATKKNTAFFFEEVLADKISSIIEKQNTNKIFEIYRNIDIFENNKKIAEYDILIVTQWGTCIALDAKTFDIKQKDFDARLLNLRKGAGRYVDFIIILPLFQSDIDEEWLPKELQNLAKKLNENNVKYYSITDTDFKINLKENYSISVKSINNLLNDLKLS